MWSKGRSKSRTKIKTEEGWGGPHLAEVKCKSQREEEYLGRNQRGEMPGKYKRRSRRKRRQVRRKRRAVPSKVRNGTRSVTQRARNTPTNLQSSWAWAQGRESMAKITFEPKKGKNSIRKTKRMRKWIYHQEEKQPGEKYSQNWS